MKVTKIAEFDPKCKFVVQGDQVQFPPFRILSEPMQIGFDLELNKYGSYKLGLFPVVPDCDSETLNKMRDFDRSACEALAKSKREQKEFFHPSSWKFKIGQVYSGAYLNLKWKDSHNVMVFESDGTPVKYDFSNLKKTLPKGSVVEIIFDVMSSYTFNKSHGLVIMPRGIRKSKIKKEVKEDVIVADMFN